MSCSSAPFATITPRPGTHKPGLDAALVAPVHTSAVAMWTVQNVDNERDYYRLYVSDGEKHYGLRVSDDGTQVTAFEASPASLASHVWFIPHLSDGFFSILDPATIRAWKVSGTTVELVEPPIDDDGLEPFKLEFSF